MTGYQWNMFPLTWTSSKPTVPGWYWYRLNPDDTMVCVVMVEPQQDLVGPWSDGLKIKLSNLVGEWAGPLEPPV